MIAAGSAALSTIGVFCCLKYVEGKRKKNAATEAEDVLRRAKLDAENFRREAEIEVKEKAMRMNEEFQNERRAARQEESERERTLAKRESALEQRAEDLTRKEKELDGVKRSYESKLAEQRRLTEELKQKRESQEKILYELSNLTREEAEKRLMKQLDRELTEEEGALILKHEKRVKEQCEQKAREVVLVALQRYAATHAAEATTSAVDIPNDDMKGRIIGREGRNIRAFEKITGVDVIIDDTPGVVIVSAFDAMRRESARRALIRLIADGRIHPARIEEIYAQCRQEVQAFAARAGREACQEIDVRGLNDRVVALLGSLFFRTSYSQNVLRHSIEVAFLAGMMAVELGLDERLARRCGLLHDVGKALDHELEGGHPKVGFDVLKRCGEPQEVCMAALYHHEDPRVANPYTTIVAAADACSAARPGARRETLEHYIKRMEELEAIAKEFPEVMQAFAVQAGREIRVLVNSERASDERAAKICRDVVKALTERIQFPGEIKVTVIRETRVTGVAK
ncbi:MAG: ribonuclease Y [Thermoguttaceae bacterium]|nr:ribonuclease Y [Thermoguttaceae bacterium]